MWAWVITVGIGLVIAVVVAAAGGTVETVLGAFAFGFAIPASILYRVRRSAYLRQFDSTRPSRLVCSSCGVALPEGLSGGACGFCGVTLTPTDDP